MTPIELLLNLLWLVFGCVWMAVGWGVAAVVMAITIIGIPWARAAFNIAVYALLPFGRCRVMSTWAAVTSAPDRSGSSDRSALLPSLKNKDPTLERLPVQRSLNFSGTCPDSQGPLVAQGLAPLSRRDRRLCVRTC